MAATLHDSIVQVMEGYLGPTAQRFVDRQIRFHLNKAPSEVTIQDLEQLNDWLRIAMALLTDDHRTIDECVQRLAQLS